VGKGHEGHEGHENHRKGGLELPAAPPLPIPDLCLSARHLCVPNLICPACLYSPPCLQLQLACLSYEDYRTILSEILGNETFESLKVGGEMRDWCGMEWMP
jgi:hypothetical protein